MQEQDLILYEGRMLTAAQITQLEATRTAVKILRAAGIDAQCRELITCRNPKYDSATIVIKLAGARP